MFQNGSEKIKKRVKHSFVEHLFFFPPFLLFDRVHMFYSPCRCRRFAFDDGRSAKRLIRYSADARDGSAERSTAGTLMIRKSPFSHHRPCPPAVLRRFDVLPTVPQPTRERARAFYQRTADHRKDYFIIAKNVTVDRNAQGPLETARSSELGPYFSFNENNDFFHRVV